MATAPQLQQLLDQLRRQGHHQITLDLSGLEFFCAAALTVLFRADQALQAVGGQLVLTRPTRRVLAITGLDTTLTINQSSGEKRRRSRPRQSLDTPSTPPHRKPSRQGPDGELTTAGE